MSAHVGKDIMYLHGLCWDQSPDYLIVYRKLEAIYP